MVVLFSLLYAVIKYEGSIYNKIKQSFVKILYFALTIFALLFLNVYAFGLLAVFAFLLLLLFIKPVYEEKPLFLLTLCAITAGIKTFFGLNLNLYGVFTFPLLLVAVIALLLFIFKKYSSDEVFIKNIEKTFAVLLICFMPLFVLRDYSKLNIKTALLTTPKGNIYNYYPAVETTKGLMDYLTANSSKNDKNNTKTDYKKIILATLGTYLFGAVLSKSANPLKGIGSILKLAGKAIALPFKLLK